MLSMSPLGARHYEEDLETIPQYIRVRKKERRKAEDPEDMEHRGSITQVAFQLQLSDILMVLQKTYFLKDVTRTATRMVLGILSVSFLPPPPVVVSNFWLTN